MLNFIKDLVTGNISVVKLGIILAMITSITGTCVWGYNSIYKAGFNEAKVESLLEIKQAREATEAIYKLKLEELTRKLSSANVEVDSQRNKAKKLQELLDSRPIVEVVREIESVSDSGCTTLGTDYGRVLDNIIGEKPNINIISRPSD